ncbi:MAG: hypothetical protein JWL94_652 [Microbacteriaceae bacterium]|nr:hypothetical protein [Microbacteriaceae bacterium]
MVHPNPQRSAVAPDGTLLARADQVTTGVIIVVAVAYLLGTLEFPDGAGVVPQIIGGAVLVLAIVQFVGPWVAPLRRYVGEPIDDSEAIVFTDPILRRRLILVLGSLAVIPALAFLLGLPVALPVYVAAFTLVDRRPVVAVIISTILISGVSVGILVLLLEMPWDSGFIWTLF